MSYDFLPIFGTVEVRTAHELPEFSCQTWQEARAAGHPSIKSIQPAPQIFPRPEAPNLYRVEFYLEGLNRTDLVAALDALAARYAEEHDVVLEPLEM